MNRHKQIIYEYRVTVVQANAPPAAGGADSLRVLRTMNSKARPVFGFAFEALKGYPSRSQRVARVTGV